jgi:hypothetical protein
MAYDRDLISRYQQRKYHNKGISVREVQGIPYYDVMADKHGGECDRAFSSGIEKADLRK